MELISLSHFLHEFLRKMFFTLYLLSQSSLHDYFYFLNIGKICTKYIIICFPVYDVINSEINLSFLINPFPYTYSELINLCSYIYEFWLAHTCFRQTWCNMFRKFMPVKAKQKHIVGGTNLLINTLYMSKKARTKI